MSNLGLQIGLKSLLASQAALETIGHNVANANTPGYSRQSVHVSAERSQMIRGLSIGGGVNADVVLRTTDALLGKRLIGQASVIAELDTRLMGMSHVEALLGEPGEHGLAGLINGFYTSFASLAASPTDPVLRTGAVESSHSLAERFHEIAGNLATVKKDNAAAIQAQTGQVNTLAQRVSHLNTEIHKFEGGGMPANDLRDQRDEALKALGGLVDVSIHETKDGSVTVTTNGALLVTSAHTYALKSDVDSDGRVTMTIAGHADPVTIKRGSIGGLLKLSKDFVPALADKIDLLAHNLIAAVNREHSTGIPAGGPFDALTGYNAITGQGVSAQTLLADAGLPFEITAGALYVNVTRTSDGSFERTRIDVDPAQMTVGDLVDALSAIEHVDARLDASGRLQVDADAGFGFDFSRRLDTQPDGSGTFGGAAASLGASGGAPYALANGQTLAVNGPAGPLAVTFASGDFADITQATADEVAAAINAAPSAATSGMHAVVTGDRVVLQSIAEGPSASFTVQGGSSLGSFGWTAGTAVSGQTNDVDVVVSGAYTGKQNGKLTFVPSGDGTIGTTNGLSVDVFDASGAKVATLDVGAGYQPGAKLAVVDGIEVSFGFGELSSTDNDAFALDVLADSDTSDVLVAFGLNSLFTGTSASDIAVRADIASDPDQLASSLTGAPSDGGTLLALVATQKDGIEALDGLDIGEFYGHVASGVGFEIEAAASARDVDQLLYDSLKSQREQISGVNVDEELVDMIRFEQAFGAASRFIQVVNSTNDEIMRLI